jgi:hypothetical protein
MSSVRGLPAELCAVRALIADGLAEITRAADDLEQFWIRSAVARLAAADATLAGLTESGAVPVSLLITTAVTAGVVAGTAALARVAGAGPAGVLAACGLLLVAALHVTGLLRRRGVPPVVPSPPETPGLGLIEVPASLDRARVRLVSAALRRAGPVNWPVPALRRAVAADPALERLARADLQLCQAIDCLERYLDDLEKAWP